MPGTNLPYDNQLMDLPPPRSGLFYTLLACVFLAAGGLCIIFLLVHAHAPS